MNNYFGIKAIYFKVSFARIKFFCLNVTYDNAENVTAIVTHCAKVILR